jgi:transcriptional regulator GlxA family with amidase domain
VPIENRLLLTGTVCETSAVGSHREVPAAYVRNIRLDMAKLLLVEGQTTLDRLAAQLGFRSEDSFRRAFERQFGIGPGVYRQSFTGAPRR